MTQSELCKSLGCEPIDTGEEVPIGNENNAITHNNMSAVKAWQEKGIVPKKQAPVVAKMLGIPLDEVRIKKG